MHGLFRHCRPVMLAAAWAVLGLAAFLNAQDTVTIRVDTAAAGKPFRPVWAFVGYDEPNYTYAPNGQKLLAELARLSPVPVYVRTHNLLTSGDGTPALKWGSTNAYSEDASGRSVYNWAILDKIFDTYIQAKMKPLVEIGFMPEALSTHPQPYQHDWPHGKFVTGWAYPPKDLGKWAELVYQWVRHVTDRYGPAEVATWYWEVWNEPDIGYWQGSPEEYFQLYDYAVEAVKRALPQARVGGPDSTSPAYPHAAQFLRQFLAHCASGRNAATGRSGAPLDFISFHAKGMPKVVEGHVQMGSRPHLQSIAAGFEIVASFPQFRKLPVILGESDPEGCAACSARVYPQAAYRNGPLYPCYTAAVLARILELASRHGINLEGVVTWAFEFEDQPYFEGFRSLATNGIDKPILNLFRMLGLMTGTSIPAASSHAIPLDTILQSGVAGGPDVSALATRGARSVSVLAWNYHDDDVPAPATTVDLVVHGLPSGVARVRVHHYRIDGESSNSYAAWKQMGSPLHPDAEQYARLEAAGQLQLLASPEWRAPEGGTLHLTFPLPRLAISLVQLSW